MFDAFWPWCKFFVLTNWHNIQLCDKFSAVICLTPFCQLQFGVIGCIILMKKYVSLTTAAMKIAETNFYNDHSNSC